MTTRRELANTLRALSMDAVQRANSGHPGMPMGMADIAQVLWADFLKHNPGNPLWVDRDRFVLSNGHGSMLLYSLLHLTGYPLGLEEIKNFRQFGSRTAGHPEHEPALGIETTTGPLGQGLAMAVGMALAEKMLAAQFNRPGLEIVAHHTYAFAGDGCMMEGISHEACSFAGRHGLGKLIVFYDDNGISIDGKVAGWFADDTAKRFEGYHWHVVPNVNGHDPDALLAAIQAARAETARPSLICCKTIIGWGAPNKQGTAATHGEALGADEVAAARKSLNWPYEPFVVPEELRTAWDHRRQGAAAEASWRELFGRYRTAHPELAREFDRRVRGDLASSWKDTATQTLEAMLKQAAPQATRQSSQAVLNIIGPALPEIFGGSADLTPSNNTMFKAARTITPEDASGNYMHYGVREFGMTAILNGVSLHGGFIPYGATFLVFSDYARNAIRLACLMSTRVVLVYTHDSIGLGEDGPTHQPVEHLTSLRALPNMSLWRPCDAAETAVAWTAGIERHGPTLLILTRQPLPQQPRTPEQLANIRRGGYTLIDCSGTPECIVIATGSEVGIAAEAVNKLNSAGQRVRLVSMPSTEAFDAQDEAYRHNVLPPTVRKRLAVEAGATLSWWRYVGLDGQVLGIDRFGASGKFADVYPHFGFTADNIAHHISGLLGLAN
jgi:transketolase